MAPSFRQIRARYEQQLQAKADEIGQIIEESSESDLQRLNLEFSKFTRLKHLVEETYLKANACLCDLCFVRGSDLPDFSGAHISPKFLFYFVFFLKLFDKKIFKKK